MSAPTELLNRLNKMHKHRRKWARRQGLTAYRIYDRDIPAHRYTVDWYAGRVLVVSFPSAEQPGKQLADEVLREVVAKACGVETALVCLKTKTPKKRGREQYEKEGQHGDRFEVEEAGLKFWVNLTDYIDTGLFLDHRNTRARVGAEAAGKRMLNLFAYTGSFSVYAARGGAKTTTSVDLSNTYLDWAAQNLALNGYGDVRHQHVRSDVVRWVEQNRGKQWDLVVLDPPSYSASKLMDGDFDVQRDHPKLLETVLGLLAPGGTLYFSTHYRGFVLEEACLGGRSFEELTPGSIPEDIRERDIHRCFRITG